jgi:hypothetical protein
LNETVDAQRCIGIDSSEHYIQLARAAAGAGLEFLCHDVLAEPPQIGADLAFARFLLTHLASPEKALTQCAGLLVRRGLLLVQEVSLLDSEHPTLIRYYQLVEAMQADYGQALYVGRDLERIAANAPFIVEHFGQRFFELPAHVMATLHALNLPTWKNDPVAQRHFDAKELAEVEQGLLRIAQRAELCAPVRVGLGELVLRADASACVRS